MAKKKDVKNTNKQEIKSTAPKDEKTFSEILTQMEQLIQGKLDSLKSAVPILFTIVTSVLAFFFLENFELTEENSSIVFIVIGLGLVLLLMIAIANFSLPKYKESIISLKMDEDFEPWNIDTYIWTGDGEFLIGMSTYCGRELTTLEAMRIRILKEKINEFRRKNILLVLTQGVMMLGILMLLLAVGILLFKNH